MVKDVSVICAWIATAIKRNVVELDLDVSAPTLPPPFEIPRRLFMCSTLVSLKLILQENISIATPSSYYFPCLKFLHVTLSYSDTDSMENLSTRFPALEDLIIDGYLADASAFNLDISALKLKQLGISFNVFAMIFAENHHQDIEDFVCQIFINVDAPNLEELDICYDFLVSYSLKNAKRLSKTKIDFIQMEELEDRGYFLGLAGHICHLFAGICTAKYLTVSALLLVALDNEQQHLLPILENLNHMEL